MDKSEREKLLRESMPTPQTPVPNWHLETVRERLAEYRATGKQGEPAKEAIERIFRNL